MVFNTACARLALFVCCSSTPLAGCQTQSIRVTGPATTKAASGATTKFRSRHSGASLEQLKPGGWAPVCNSPCDPVLHDGAYRVVTPYADPEEFRLIGGGPVGIEVSGGEPGLRTAGGLLMLVGVAAGTVGVAKGLGSLCYAYCSEEDERDTEQANVLVYGGTGAFLLGTLLVIGGRQTIEIERRGEPRVKAGRFELSPRGLHF